MFHYLIYANRNINNKIDYEKFSLTTGLVHNFEKNSDLPSSSSLNKKTSDLVGDLEYNINRNLKMSYNYSVENNFKESNYNDVGMELSLNDTKFNINYLEKKNQFGHEESVSSGLDFKIKDSAELSFSTKRNLVTRSAEFYSMSYNYINDCLKAGL